MSDSEKQDDQNAGTAGKPDELSDKDLEQVSGGSLGIGSTISNPLTHTGWIEITGNVGNQETKV